MARVMLRVLMDRKDKDGNIIEKGGVLEDNLQKVLGHIYDESRYYRDGTRNKEKNKGILTPNFK